MLKNIAIYLTCFMWIIPSCGPPLIYKIPNYHDSAKGRMFKHPLVLVQSDDIIKLSDTGRWRSSMKIVGETMIIPLQWETANTVRLGEPIFCCLSDTKTLGDVLAEYNPDIFSICYMLIVHKNYPPVIINTYTHGDLGVEDEHNRLIQIVELAKLPILEQNKINLIIANELISDEWHFNNKIKFSYIRYSDAIHNGFYLHCPELIEPPRFYYNRYENSAEFMFSWPIKNGTEQHGLHIISRYTQDTKDKIQNYLGV